MVDAKLQPPHSFTTLSWRSVHHASSRTHGDCYRGRGIGDRVLGGASAAEPTNRYELALRSLVGRSSQRPRRGHATPGHETEISARSQGEQLTVGSWQTAGTISGTTISGTTGEPVGIRVLFQSELLHTVSGSATPSPPWS
jgi:hypothetical protein